MGRPADKQAADGVDNAICVTGNKVLSWDKSNNY